MKKMYKYISYCLSLTLLFSFLIVTPTFALTEELTSSELEKGQDHFCNVCCKSMEEFAETGVVSTAISPNEILSRLVSQSPFSLEGVLVNDEQMTDLNEFYNFSTMSRFEIASWACKNDLITETQMIESYCDLLISKNFENVICLDSIYHQIKEYNNKSLVSNILNQKINGVLDQAEQLLTKPSNIRSPMHVSDGQIIVDAYNEDIPYNELNRILNMAQTIRTNYFNQGIQLISSSYVISLDTSPNGGPACYTGPIGGSETNDQYMSVTTLFVSLDGEGNIADNDAEIRQRLAHGMFHAIQNTYHSAGGWFKEACADWGAYAATGLTTNINLNAFINSRDSITANVGHGAMLFPLTIARYYGGAATIMEIYDQFRTLEAEDFLWDEEHWQEISFEALEWKINVALDERGYSANFADIYTQMVTYLATPDDCYGFLGVELYNDSSAHIVYCDGDNSFEEDYLEGLEKVYFTFEPDEDLSGYTIEFTLEIFDGVGSAYQYWYNDQGEIYTSSLIINGSGQVTFTHPHYDEGNPSGFVGIAVNGIDEDEYLSIFIDYTVTSD